MKKLALFLVLLFTTITIFSQENKDFISSVEFIKSPKVLYRGIYNKIKINIPKTDSIQLYGHKDIIITKSISG